MTVVVQTGSGPDAATQTEVIPARTVLWGAGVIASSFARRVAEATGAATDRNGRVLVEPDLTVPGHPEIFVDRGRGRGALEAGPADAGRRPGRDAGWDARGPYHPAARAPAAHGDVPLQRTRGTSR